MNPFVQKATGKSHQRSFLPAERPAGKRIEMGSDQQEDLWRVVLSPGSGNVVVEARAGSGKSSSCREAMWRLLERQPGLNVRYAVFNKRNAVEFEADCPPGVSVGTIHSFGMRALIAAFRPIVDANKSYAVLNGLPGGDKLPGYRRRAVKRVVEQAKNRGLLPGQPDLTDELLGIIDHFEIEVYGHEFAVAEWAGEVLERSAARTGTIDFEDMLWLPYVHKLPFPKCDVLFLDEVQDWNPVQRMLIPSLCRSGRVVAVGDTYQSLYAFRGADAESMARVREDLAASGSLAELPLTISWRCPALHVELAQRYVPDIRARDGAPSGEIGHCGHGEAHGEYAGGDMVICPANAPIVKAALKLIAERRPAVVRGRSIGDQLMQVLGKVTEARTIRDCALTVERWRAKELQRLADKEGVEDAIEGVEDRANGALAVLSACDSPAEVPSVIGELFADDVSPGATTEAGDRAVIFSTIHRAKGLEADRVWVITQTPRATKKDWQRQQRRNLKYVAATRSKDYLCFVDDAASNGEQCANVT